MGKKKDKYVYKKRKIPHFVELLDKRLLRDYIWQRPNADPIPIQVYRFISLCTLTDDDNDARAYWYIVEHQNYNSEYPRTLMYGFFRRPNWDR